MTIHDNQNIKAFEEYVLTQLKEKRFDVSQIELEIIKFIDNDHKDCLWYGGPVAEVKYKEYLFSLEARGDVNCTLFDKNNNELGYVKDRNNAGSFRYEMAHCLSNDAELSKAKNDGLLVLENNNWFEIFVRTPSMDWQQATWVSESDNLEECVLEMIETMDEMIEEIEKNKLNKEKNGFKTNEECALALFLHLKTVGTIEGTEYDRETILHDINNLRAYEWLQHVDRKEETKRFFSYFNIEKPILDWEEMSIKYPEDRDEMPLERERAFVNDCFDIMEREGFSDRFWSPFGDYKERFGQPFKVVERCTEKSCDIAALPMWNIRFEDGTVVGAYPEEIVPSEMKVHGCPYFNEASLVQKVAEASRRSKTTEISDKTRQEYIME